MDDTDAVLAYILADCKGGNDMAWYIGRLATMLQYLVCCKAREFDETASGIRMLYMTWADTALEQFADPRRFPCKKPH